MRHLLQSVRRPRNGQYCPVSLMDRQCGQRPVTDDVPQSIVPSTLAELHAKD
ncbi:MAG: hypothetical protein KDB05_31675 [Planctomycetales bacterium]|nr:hypothetical protein [Planctomycetales bacterium]